MPHQMISPQQQTVSICRHWLLGLDTVNPNHHHVMVAECWLLIGAHSSLPGFWLAALNCLNFELDDICLCLVHCSRLCTVQQQYYLQWATLYTLNCMWSHLNNLSNVYSLLAFSKSSRLFILKSEKRNQRYHTTCIFFAMKLYSVNNSSIT